MSATGFPDRLPEGFEPAYPADDSDRDILRITFENGESLLLQHTINGTLLIVSSTGELKSHMCENGSLTVRPVVKP